MELEVIVVRRVEFASERLYGGGLVGTFEEEDDRQEEAHFDCNSEVEEDGEDEGHEHDDEVGLRVLGQPHDGTNLGHVVANHDEDTRKACHRDERNEWTEE